MALPLGFRSFGGHCALLCAAIAGIVPFLGMAILACLDSGEEVTDIARTAQVPTMQQPIVIDSRPSSTDDRLANVLADLQRSLQQQDHARQSTEAAINNRMQTLEQALASAAPARSTTASITDGLSEAQDMLAELGVDWAAWGAGAEIDHAFTSCGLGREPSVNGIFGRAVRAMASVAPRYRALASSISHPPEVVLATDVVAPSKCFSFAGNGTVAIRFLHPQRVTHAVVERPPAWATLQPLAAPRFIEVRGWVAKEGAEPYRAALGSFEYASAGPRAQVFATGDVGVVQAVQFAFGRNWGEGHTSVCRLRLFGPRL